MSFQFRCCLLVKNHSICIDAPFFVNLASSISQDAAEEIATERSFSESLRNGQAELDQPGERIARWHFAIMLLHTCRPSYAYNATRGVVHSPFSRSSQSIAGACSRSGRNGRYSSQSGSSARFFGSFSTSYSQSNFKNVKCWLMGGCLAAVVSISILFFCFFPFKICHSYTCCRLLTCS